MDPAKDVSEKATGECSDSIADSKDFYTVLGIPKTATEKQISSAYKKLALKYHPDRNQDDEEAARMFKAVSEAYHVLIDPNKRRQYDIGGEKAASTEFESVDVSSLGGIGRVLGSLISRLGVPIPTQIAPEIIQTAHDICRDGGLEGGGPPLDPRVSDLAWGWPVDSKVDRQAATYYRINVDSRHVENGFVVLCRSLSKGKFKLILFDGEGSVLFQEESAQTREKKAVTEAALYFTKFETYRLGEPSAATVADKETPSTFAKLESFTECRRSIPAGKYLLCVYGDNFISKTHFNIIAVQAKNDAPEVKLLESTDAQLLESKAGLEAMRAEYLKARAAFEDVRSRMEAEGKRLDALLQTRDAAYHGFFNASIKEFSPSVAAVDPAVSDASPAASTTEAPASSGATETTAPATLQPSIGSVASSAAASVASAGATAAQTATAAGGWLARRVSLGLASIVKPASGRSRTASEEMSALSADATAAETSVPTPVPSPVSADEAVIESAVSSTKPGAADPATADDSSVASADVTPSTEPGTATGEAESVAAADAAQPLAEEEDVHSPSPAAEITRPVIKGKKDKKAAADAEV